MTIPHECIPLMKTRMLWTLAIAFLFSNCLQKPDASQSVDQVKDSTKFTRIVKPIASYSTWVGVNGDSIFIKLGDSTMEFTPKKRKHFSPVKGVRKKDLVSIGPDSRIIRILHESKDSLILESNDTGSLSLFKKEIIFTRIEDIPTFMARFSSDEELQKSRIIFPLAFLDDSTGVVTHLTSKDWDAERSFPDVTACEHCLEENTMSKLNPAADRVTWQVCETDAFTRYEFVRKGKSWFLVREVGREFSR